MPDTCRVKHRYRVVRVGAVCSYCGADQPGSEHREDCVVLAAERRLAGGESEK